MPMHPLPVIMNQGIPVVLSSDDPAMFNSMGLSFDFFQVTLFLVCLLLQPDSSVAYRYWWQVKLRDSLLLATWPVTVLR